MGSAFHQLCPRYSGTLTSTAPTAYRLWEGVTDKQTILLTSLYCTFSLPLSENGIKNMCVAARGGGERRGHRCRFIFSSISTRHYYGVL